MGFKEGELGRQVVLRHKVLTNGERLRLRERLKLANIELFVQNEYNRHRDWQTDGYNFSIIISKNLSVTTTPLFPHLHFSQYYTI